MSGTPGAPGAFHDLSNTKVGAREAEQRAIQHARYGENETPRTRKEEVPTVSGFTERFLKSYKPTSNPSTKRSRQRILENHICPVIGHKRLDRLVQSDVSLLIEAWNGRAEKTINNRLAVLSSLVKFAVKLGVIPEPRHKLNCQIAPGIVEMEAVSPAELEKLLDAATEERIRLAVLLCYEAGLRAGEVRGLQWGDLDLSAGQLTIRRSVDNQSSELIPPKGKKARTVPVSPRLRAALSSATKLGIWVVPRRDGGLLGYSALNKPMRRLYDAAGVTAPRSQPMPYGTASGLSSRLKACPSRQSRS